MGQYNPNTQDCCNGVIFTRGSQECCNAEEIVPAGQCELAVDITPSEDKIVAKNTSVSFSATPKGGKAPYTYEWTFDNGTPASASSQSAEVTFGDAAEGGSNCCTVTVRDARGKTASASVTITIPSVSLRMDADANGTLDSTDDEKKLDPGVIVFENSDNDANDADGKPDKANSPVPYEDDLVGIALGIAPSLNSGSVRLEAAAGMSRIKIWATGGKQSGTEITLPKEWNLASDPLPSQLYVEGVEKSANPNDVELKLSYSNGGNHISEDKVKITVVRLNLGVAVYRDMHLWGFGEINHAGLVTGYTGSRVRTALTNDVNWVVTETTPIAGIRTVGLQTFTQPANEFHGVYSVPNLTDERRNLILANAAACRQRPIGWVGADAIVPEAWDGTIATIQKLRCDGVVEVCYELAGAEVWGRNGTNYLIQNWTAEHNDLSMNEPQTELSPVVQRGGVPNSPTKLIRLGERVLFEPQNLP